MKRHFSICATMIALFLLSGCYNETTHPKTSISECDPNLREAIVRRVPQRILTAEVPNVIDTIICFGR